MCQFLWCKDSQYVSCQATIVLSLNIDLGSEGHSFLRKFISSWAHMYLFSLLLCSHDLGQHLAYCGSS